MVGLSDALGLAGRQIHYGEEDALQSLERLQDHIFPIEVRTYETP